MVSILDNETKMSGESRSRQVRGNRAYAINRKRELALARLPGSAGHTGRLVCSERRGTLPYRKMRMASLARIQAARASYALATTTDMERVGNGAWLRRRHVTRVDCPSNSLVECSVENTSP